MSTLQLPEPIKLFASLLWSEVDALGRALALLEERIGSLDYQGPDHLFDATDYYEREMGSGLQKRLVSFEKLAAPESIVELKLETMKVEDELRSQTGRRVNTDPGYLDLHKVVLASAKPGPQKIHLGRGVYADIVLRYSQGKFHPFEWTFKDYREGRYEKELLEIRARYKRG